MLTKGPAQSGRLGTETEQHVVVEVYAVICDQHARQRLGAILSKGPLPSLHKPCTLPRCPARFLGCSVQANSSRVEWPVPTGLSSLAPDPGPMALRNRPQSPNLPISTPQTNERQTHK